MEHGADLAQYGLAGTVALLIVKEIIALFKRDAKQFGDELLNNTKAIHEHTVSLVKLDLGIAHLNEKLDRLNKLEKDVNSAHQTIRELKKDLEQISEQ